MTKKEKSQRRKLISERVGVCRALRLAQKAREILHLSKKGRIFSREQIDESRETLLKQRELSY